jgi:hypothetical protein
VKDNETEEDITTGRQVGGVANANETTDRRQKKGSKYTYDNGNMVLPSEGNMCGRVLLLLVEVDCSGLDLKPK